MWSNIVKENKEKKIIKKVEKKKIIKKNNDSVFHFYDVEQEFSIIYDDIIIDIIDDFNKLIDVNGFGYRFKDRIVGNTLFDFIKFNSFEYIDTETNIQRLNDEYNNDYDEQYSDEEYYE